LSIVGKYKIISILMTDRLLVQRLCVNHSERLFLLRSIHVLFWYTSTLTYLYR